MAKREGITVEIPSQHSFLMRKQQTALLTTLVVKSKCSLCWLVCECIDVPGEGLLRLLLALHRFLLLGEELICIDGSRTLLIKLLLELIFQFVS